MLQTYRVMVCKCFFFSRLTEPIFLLLYGLLIFVFSLWKSVEILRMGEGEVSKLIIIFNGKILTELEFSEGFQLQGYGYFFQQHQNSGAFFKI